MAVHSPGVAGRDKGKSARGQGERFSGLRESPIADAESATDDRIGEPAIPSRHDSRKTPTPVLARECDMHSTPKIRFLTVTSLLLLAICAAPLLAREVAESVRIDRAVADDVYAAGGAVDALAAVDGDLVLVGGRISVGERVDGDVIAAGGFLHLQADVSDDVRIAGGHVVLAGVIGDDAIAAGGSVTLARSAKVGGNAWLAGGRIDVAGGVDRELVATGGRITVSGHIKGNVKLRGERIIIVDSAVIDGDLAYSSPRQAEIAPGATLNGETQFDVVDRPLAPVLAAALGAFAALLVSLLVTGCALFFLFPRFTEASLDAIRREPWISVALGLAVFAATPVVSGLLFASVVGWLPALLVGVLYPILLLCGLLVGACYLGDRMAGLARRSTLSVGLRIASFAAALVVILVLAVIPVLGTLVLLAVVFTGTGALVSCAYDAYTGKSGGRLVGDAANPSESRTQ